MIPGCFKVKTYFIKILPVRRTITFAGFFSQTFFIGFYTLIIQVVS